MIDGHSSPRELHSLLKLISPALPLVPAEPPPVTTNTAIDINNDGSTTTLTSTASEVSSAPGVQPPHSRDVDADGRDSMIEPPIHTHDDGCLVSCMAKYLLEFW